jgi:site-specific recombinase XerD
MLTTTETTLTLESIERFRNWCIARGQSRHTAKAYTADLRMLLQWWGERTMTHSAVTISLESLEPAAMMWLNETREAVAPKTTTRRLTSIRSFGRWIGHPHLLSEYRPPTPAKGQPHPIKELSDGLDRLIEACATPQQRALVGYIGFVGLRVHEALAVRPDWLDVHTMTLRVRGKGDKERFVPVSAKAWSAISVAHVEAMVRSMTSPVLTYQDRYARKTITALGRKANLSRPIASHDLRATFATLVYEKTLDQRVVQELLGHANGTTTEVYLGVNQSKMKEGVEF